MSRFRKSDGSKDTDNAAELSQVIPFATRLELLHTDLLRLSHTVNIVEPEIPAHEQDALAAEYSRLAEFTRLLAAAAQRMKAEISESGGVLRKMGQMNPLLQRQLREGLDKQLIEEIGNHYNDGDTANLAKQISAFVNVLRDPYDLGRH